MDKEIHTQNKKDSMFKKPWVQSVLGLIVIVLVAGGALFYKSASSSIKIDDSLVSAPVINIGPQAAGVLDEVYVRAGDTVTAGQILGRVDAEVLTSKVAGIIIDVVNTPGQVFQASQPVVKMIDPNEFRIVGTIKENEGLADIAVGDPVSFTVDAFDGETFAGVVDSVSPSAKESGVTFSISDKREVRQFEVKVRYDVAAHPLFKNGMSAKMKVFAEK